MVDHHVGRVNVSDDDKEDEVDLELQGADARAFHIFPTGDLVIIEPGRLNQTVARLVEETLWRLPDKSKPKLSMIIRT